VKIAVICEDFVDEDWLAVAVAIHDMADGPGVPDLQLARHEARNTQADQWNDNPTPPLPAADVPFAEVEMIAHQAD
jgi:hypothetical protein